MSGIVDALFKVVRSECKQREYAFASNMIESERRGDHPEEHIAELIMEKNGVKMSIYAVLELLEEHRHKSAIVSRCVESIKLEWIDYMTHVRSDEAVYPVFFSQMEHDQLIPDAYSKRVFAQAEVGTLMSNPMWMLTRGRVEEPRMLARICRQVKKLHAQMGAPLSLTRKRAREACIVNRPPDCDDVVERINAITKECNARMAALRITMDKRNSIMSSLQKSIGDLEVYMDGMRKALAILLVAGDSISTYKRDMDQQMRRTWSRFGDELDKRKDAKDYVLEYVQSELDACDVVASVEPNMSGLQAEWKHSAVHDYATGSKGVINAFATMLCTQTCAELNDAVSRADAQMQPLTAWLTHWSSQVSTACTGDIDNIAVARPSSALHDQNKSTLGEYEMRKNNREMAIELKSWLGDDEDDFGTTAAWMISQCRSRADTALFEPRRDNKLIAYCDIRQRYVASLNMDKSSVSRLVLLDEYAHIAVRDNLRKGLNTMLVKVADIARPLFVPSVYEGSDLTWHVQLPSWNNIAMRMRTEHEALSSKPYCRDLLDAARRLITQTQNNNASTPTLLEIVNAALGLYEANDTP